MKNNALILVIILLSTLSFSTYGNEQFSSERAISDYLEKGPAKDYLTENEFGNVISILHYIYSPIMKSVGGAKFNIHADWDDETVNAYASRDGKNWNLHISGGIARAEGMNQDSFAFIVCHEIGHHLGGAPLTHRFDGWPTAEGQADYWATSKCMKRYYNFLKDEAFIVDETLPQKALTDCSLVYPTALDYRICVRTMNAVAALTKFLNALPDARHAVSILTPDARQVKGTNRNDYPRPQCRVDTVYSGALCYLDAGHATSKDDQKYGHCNDYSKPGARPRCWFKPQ